MKTRTQILRVRVFIFVFLFLNLRRFVFRTSGPLYLGDSITCISVHLSVAIKFQLILYLKFKLSNEKTAFVPRDNVIFYNIIPHNELVQSEN